MGVKRKASPVLSVQRLPSHAWNPYEINPEEQKPRSYPYGKIFSCEEDEMLSSTTSVNFQNMLLNDMQGVV